MQKIGMKSITNVHKVHIRKSKNVRIKIKYVYYMIQLYSKINVYHVECLYVALFFYIIKMDEVSL